VNDRAWGHGGGKRRSFPRDEHVDVRPDAGPGVEQAVADAGHLRVEVGDDVGDRHAACLESPRRAREQADERSRQVDVGQGSGRDQLTTAASTDQIDGRLSATSIQLRPSSRLPYTWPVLVPKYTPTGSSRSTAIASRSTPR